MNPEYINRILNPEKYPFIKNKDGTVATHEMAAEQDEKGNWFAFPMIVQFPDGTLHRFQDPKSAMSYNLRTGNFKHFKKNKNAALNYANDGYKKGTPLENFGIKKGN